MQRLNRNRHCQFKVEIKGIRVTHKNTLAKCSESGSIWRGRNETCQKILDFGFQGLEERNRLLQNEKYFD